MTAPRIAPGGRREIGLVNSGLARLAGLATGGPPPHVFTTLARHPRLFRKWLRFAGALMPGGLLPRADSELLILRVAHNCDCDYEWVQHERIALTAGLSADQVERVHAGPEAAGWSERQELLLRAADELHERRTLSTDLWERLRALLGDAELIELCMLIGHYEMLAMTLNALAVEPDVLSPGPPTRAMRLAQALTRGRRRTE